MYQSQLEEVAIKGAPAQAAHARDLLTRANEAETPLPESLVTEIELLVDAYLHDPHLTRNNVGRELAERRKLSGHPGVGLDLVQPPERPGRSR